MTSHEKCLFIIDLLDLSAMQVANAINLSGSAVAKKKKQEKGNRFLEKDFNSLKDHYMNILGKVQKL